MKRKLLIVLYFVDGPIPSDAETADMDQYGQGYTVRQRNVQVVHADDCMETFDIVAGAVPANYAAKYAEQGEPVLPENKRISAEGIAEGNPLAPPPAAEGTSEASPPAKAPEGAEKGAGGAAKPKTPTPNPGAGWKPNA